MGWSAILNQPQSAQTRHNGNLRSAMHEAYAQGARLPDGQRWTFDANGNVTTEEKPGWVKALPYLAFGAAAAPAAIGAIGAMGGAAGAGGAGATSTATGAGAGTGAALTGTGAAGAGMTTGKLLETLLPIGANAYQAWNAHRAENKAAQQEAFGYERAAQNLGPYNQLGLQASNSLAALLGLEGMHLDNAGGLMPPVTDTEMPMTAHSRALPAPAQSLAPSAPPVLSRGSRLMDLARDDEPRRPKNQSSYTKGRD